MKNYLRILLILLLSIVADVASAKDHKEFINGINYNLSGNEASVTFGDSIKAYDPDYDIFVYVYSSPYSGDLVIPQTVTDYYGKTYTVTSIGDHAFEGCRKLYSVTIPNTVTSIGNSAFYYCDKRNPIIIPNGVISIGNGAFKKCSSLTTITFPESLTHIGTNAFFYVKG